MINSIKKWVNKLVGNYYVPIEQNHNMDDDPDKIYMTINTWKGVAWHTDLTKEEAEKACKILNKRMELV